jgi:hypothetical protein
MAISIALQKHFYCPALYENHTLKIVSSKEERGKKENASLAVCMSKHKSMHGTEQNRHTQL